MYNENLAVKLIHNRQSDVAHKVLDYKSIPNVIQNIQDLIVGDADVAEGIFDYGIRRASKRSETMIEFESAIVRTRNGVRTEV